MLYLENVFDYHLTLLKKVFACPVLRHCGHAERALMAVSMPDDDHCFFWPQYGYFALVHEAGKSITKPGMLREMAGTGVDNQVMLFVRGPTGDMAILSNTPDPLLPGCPMGERIESRRQELLVCSEHRLISISSISVVHSDVFAELNAIQYEQAKPGHFFLKVVTERSLSAESRRRIVQAMETKTQGGYTAEVVEASEILPAWLGKHRMHVQHLDIFRNLGTPAQA